MSPSRNRIPLIVALGVFVISELSGASFTHAAQRAAVGFGIALVIKAVWGWVLLPWLRATLEAQASTAEAETDGQADSERQQEKMAA